MKRNDFELLMPVGQKEMALAAIHNGADAIFLGMPRFNARGRSADFSIEELREIIETCHLMGVKVNIAFNILIFENELSAAKEALEKVLPLQPDAFIVQDLGLVQLIKQMAPQQVVHASTQMTVTNDLAINFLSDLKIRRFVLGRENSLGEIKKIAESTKAELEVFVHGALCVSYSGQCFTSENLGGRSANRGQCAQSCRFAYELFVDGEKKQDLEEKFLVSPQDLCGIAEIPELMKIGVKSFKVEGRLKTPQYVASVASSFNSAIEATLKGADLTQSQIAQEKQKMAVAYSRGFFPGWLHGVQHQQLVEGHFNSHRGARIGVIRSAKSNAICVQLDNPIELQPGDGILWATGGKETEEGSYIYSVDDAGQSVVWIGIENGLLKEIETQNRLRGAPVFLNYSKNQSHQLHLQMVDRHYQKKIKIDIQVNLKLGSLVDVTFSDGNFKVICQSEVEVSEAVKKPVTAEAIKQEISSLGGTVFTPQNVEVICPEGLFIPMGEIKKLRQKSVTCLETLRRSLKIDHQNFEKNREIQGEKGVLDFLEKHPVEIFDSSLGNSNFLTHESLPKWDSDSVLQNQKHLSLLLRDRFQVRSLFEAIKNKKLFSNQIEGVTLDFEFGRDYKESILLLKEVGLRSGIATTRILKPGEVLNLKVIHQLDPDFILVRNLGALHFYRSMMPFKGELVGDFSLNAANSRTATYLLAKGLSRLSVSYDLNREQVDALLDSMQAQGLASQMEVTLHQAMPSFHMEHCVFAAFLSEGNSYRDCGKPCEKHQVKLKDQYGHWHYIKPDQECRNTMYNAVSQSAISFVEDWTHKGLKHFRYEALAEQGDELISKIKSYLEYFEGAKDLATIKTEIATKESYGLSTGNLEKAHTYQSRKKEL